MSVQLGVVSARSHRGQGGFCGGRSLLVGASCGVCGHGLVCLLQMPAFAPTAPHRSIRVYVCPHPSCQKNHVAWRVVRYNDKHKVNVHSTVIANIAPTPQPAPILATASGDNWGLTSAADDWGVVSSASHTTAAAEHESVSTEDLEALLNLRDLKLAGKVDAPKVGLEAEVKRPKSPMLPSTAFYYHPMGLDVEDEPYSASDDTEFVTDREREIIEEYEAREGKIATDTKAVSVTSTDWDQEEYEKDFISHGNDFFHHFHKRVMRQPDQVLRYAYGETPLLTSAKDKDAALHKPPCKNCGGPTQFELQILPTILAKLTASGELEPTKEAIANPQDLSYVKSLLAQLSDWGTVLIYSCDVSCEPKDGRDYVEESVYVQLDDDYQYR